MVKDSARPELWDERFEPVEDRPAARSLGVFQGKERWQVWKRRL